MRSVLAILGIYLLALLLAGSFPIGAGDAAHGGALLHPAFPHSHAPGEPTRAATPSHSLTLSHLVTFDSSAGGATEVPTTALTPPVPRWLAGSSAMPQARLVRREDPWPLSQLDPPPEPPPPTSSVRSA